MKIKNGNDIIKIEEYIKYMVENDIREIVYKYYPKFANKYFRPSEIMLKKSFNIEMIEMMIKICDGRIK